MNSWKIYKYSEPGPFLEHIEFKGRWGIFFIARKQSQSTYNNDISQNYFKKLWESKTTDSAENASKQSKPKDAGIIKRLYRLLPFKLRARIWALIYGRAKVVKPIIPFKEIDIKNRRFGR